MYEIPTGVVSFTATGVRPSGDKNIWGEWSYRVKIDGKKVYESGELKKEPNMEIPISIPIPPVSKRDIFGNRSTWK